MVKKYVRFVAIASLVASLSLFAAGCSQKTVKTDSETDTAAASKEVAGSERGGMNAPTGSEEPLETPPARNTARLTILEGRTTGPMLPIYYDFDKANIKPDQRGRLADNARYVKENGVSIVIEGNCDERGTNEYNMALGERRAISAKKYMVNLGVDAGKIRTVSYGEEKPLNRGHDELAWSQNRRSDFVQVR